MDYFFWKAAKHTSIHWVGEDGRDSLAPKIKLWVEVELWDILFYLRILLFVLFHNFLFYFCFYFKLYSFIDFCRRTHRKFYFF